MKATKRAKKNTKALAAWILTCFEREWPLVLSRMGFTLGVRSAIGSELALIASFGEDDFELVDGPEGLAARILREAHRDAAVQRGTPRYVVKAHLDGEEKHFSKHIFRLEGRLGTAVRDIDAEDTIRRLKQQVRKLKQRDATNEALVIVTRSLAAQQRVIESLQQQNDLLHVQTNKLASEQHKTLELQRDLMHEIGRLQTERDVAQRSGEGRESRSATDA
jgi:hypothetical protein